MMVDIGQVKTCSHRQMDGAMGAVSGAPLTARLLASKLLSFINTSTSTEHYVE